MAKKAKKVAAVKAAPKAAAKGAKEVVNKGMLVDAVAEKLEGAVSKKDTKAVLDALLTTVVESVRKGGEVRLVGFGTFKQSHRAARTLQFRLLLRMLSHSNPASNSNNRQNGRPSGRLFCYPGMLKHQHTTPKSKYLHFGVIIKKDGLNEHT